MKKATMMSQAASTAAAEYFFAPAILIIFRLYG